mmetsp:Transcript_21634/g.45122  ORF Transcript_21634/g.45122 Transcript_21634/m.45122 type:complete len:231 (+) Transcript_21634:300-992(+)
MHLRKLLYPSEPHSVDTSIIRLFLQMCEIWARTSCALAMERALMKLREHHSGWESFEEVLERESCLYLLAALLSGPGGTYTASFCQALYTDLSEGRSPSQALNLACAALALSLSLSSDGRKKMLSALAIPTTVRTSAVQPYEVDLIIRFAHSTLTGSCAILFPCSVIRADASMALSLCSSSKPLTSLSLSGTSRNSKFGTSDTPMVRSSSMTLESFDMRISGIGSSSMAR